MAWPVLDHPTPFGFAHQGGHDVAPGNTDAAFAHAVAQGYRYIETDVQATSDGVLVIFHDDTLDNLTNGTGRIEDKTWAEVSELRVGPDGAHPLPRFDDVVTRYPDVRFNIDPKTEAAIVPLIDAVRDLDLIDRVLIGSFSDGRISRVRAGLGPSLATSPGPFGMAKLLLLALLRPGSSVDYAAVQIPRRYGPLPLANRWLIGRFHRLGLQVHIWTINDEAEMNELLDGGVDAIMTDEVELLRRVLDARTS